MARKMFSCDFETTTKLEDCRVWAYGWMEIGNKKNFKIGNSLDEFMEWCSKINADLFFHNLRFDGEFIVHYLLSKGFKHDREGTGLANTFTTTISNMGQWYIVDICYGYKGKKKIHTVIYDSLKKLPFPVKKIAKDFKLEVMKGDIDYHAERPIGHKITDEEFQYIKNDIEIIATALEIQFQQGLDKITAGSDSLKGFKSVISTKNFEKHFPVFSLKMDKTMRDFYRGGFTWVNKRLQGVMVGAGIVFDVNSLYPSVMYYRDLPYGVPIPYEGKYEYDEQYPLYMQRLKCEFRLKPNHIPTIQIKGSAFFRENEYLENSDFERVELNLTSVDLELFLEHYDVFDLEYIEGWKFKKINGLFKDFIDKWMYIKTTSDGAIKALAKLMLNSLYGKFATNPLVTGKVPYLKDDGSVGYTLPRDEETGEVIDEYKDPIYTPMGAFITAWARYVTITTAQKCYDRIIYCDTDSIHLTGTEIPDAIKDIVDPNKLGYWKHEGTFTRGKFLRQKTYVEQYGNHMGWWNTDKKWNGKTVKLWTIRPDVKCAGMPDRIKEKVTFQNFEVGFTRWGKLLPKHVNGGVVLVDSEFTIK